MEEFWRPDLRGPAIQTGKIGDEIKEKLASEESPVRFRIHG